MFSHKRRSATLGQRLRRLLAQLVLSAVKTIEI